MTINRLFQSLKKCRYLKDKNLVKLTTNVKETINKNNKNIVLLRLD